MALDLAADDYRLRLTPEAGGSIARFDWRGEPLMREACGPSIFDTACFPLVPFSNRIALSRFRRAGDTVQLSPNFPASDHPHTLHGFGWLTPWSVVEAGADHALIRHTYEQGAWPWAYVAEQNIQLSGAGLRHEIRLTNLGATSMPAELGLHPYFPRTGQTILQSRHKGEWRTSEDGLPLSLQRANEARDWWRGEPVASRTVDTVYTERQGPMEIIWPERALRLVIAPCDLLTFTVVYTPPGADFFCVEPVSHMTDAVNRRGDDTGLHWLQKDKTLSAVTTFRASRL